MRVITWQAPCGDTLDVCPACEGRYRAGAAAWPRNSVGEEYCTVAHGLHAGECEAPEHGEELTLTPNEED